MGDRKETHIWALCWKETCQSGQRTGRQAEVGRQAEPGCLPELQMRRPESGKPGKPTKKMLDDTGY